MREASKLLRMRFSQAAGKDVFDAVEVGIVKVRT